MNLLVAHWRPLRPHTNSGDLRLAEILRLLREAGHRVSFMPPEPPNAEQTEVLEGLGLGREWSIATALAQPQAFGQYLRGRRFACALLSPYVTLLQLRELIRRNLPACGLILDTIDLQHVRFRRQAELSGRAEDREHAEAVAREEWEALRKADSVWVVTEAEKALLGRLRRPVYVVPTIHEVAPDRVPFEERSGVVFLANYAHLPNVDAVRFLMREIWPRVSARCPDMTLTLAGSQPPAEFAEYAAQWPGVAVTGYVADHRALLMRHRVAVAPLRYGAGMKGKIGESLACGTPTVTTRIGAEGMGLGHERQALIADDPERFAQEVVRLHEDAALWERLSRNGCAHVAAHWSRAVVGPRVLAAVRRTASRRRLRAWAGRLKRRLLR